jgi:hypothetical protein
MIALEMDCAWTVIAYASQAVLVSIAAWSYALQAKLALHASTKVAYVTVPDTACASTASVLVTMTTQEMIAQFQ